MLNRLYLSPDEIQKYVQSNSSDNCVYHYNVEISNLFDSELQLINTKLVIKNKLKELWNELKKFEVQTIVFLDFKKRNDCKIFHSSAKLIANDSDIEETFKSMRQSVKWKYTSWKLWVAILRKLIYKLRVIFYELQF